MFYYDRPFFISNDDFILNFTLSFLNITPSSISDYYMHPFIFNLYFSFSLKCCSCEKQVLSLKWHNYCILKQYRTFAIMIFSIDEFKQWKYILFSCPFLLIKFLYLMCRLTFLTAPPSAKYAESMYLSHIFFTFSSIGVEHLTSVSIYSPLNAEILRAS